MLIKTVENFMNIKKTLAWAITGSLLLVSAVSAEVPKGDKNAGKTLANRLARSVDDGPSSTFFNVNSWKIQMENQGFFAWNGTSHGSAGNYPIGMGSVIFAEGILWGAKVTDKYGVDASGALLTDGSGGGTPRIRVNGSMYNTGLKAGKVLRDATGRIKDTGYSEDYRTQQIYRVRKNWNTANLTNDIAIIKNIEPSDVTEAQVAAGKSQYEKDWLNWPADEGAPFDDVNGDGVINADDRTKIGDPFADFSIGWNFNLNVYNFDLSVFTYGSFGNDVYRAYERNLNYTNKFARVLDRWTGEGTSNTEPRYAFVDGNNNTRASDRYVEDGSFIKIKNVQLGYNFDLNESSAFDSVRLYLQGKNLLTITDYTGYDPEMSGGVLGSGIDRGNYPTPRIVSVGLNVKF